MAENKTQPTDASVEDFIAAVADPARREDCRRVAAMMQAASGAPPVMWGASIVGFGRYRYTYASGRTGDWPVIGFSPRKAQTVLYVMGGFEGQDDLVARLGKVKTSVACLYVNRLDQIDIDVLREMASRSLAENQKRYPEV